MFSMAKQQHAANQLLFDFDMIEEELFLNGNIQNIKYMLPRLFHTQHEDVAFAERRFKQGKGVLFTNGTGTGKTYVGLGIIYRFYKQHKRNIIIVVPTDKKANDWIEEGITIGLSITQLMGTHDAGFDIVVTTYANFYQNNALNQRNWDLVIYDESHYLNQNGQGNETVYHEKHQWIANIPSAVRKKADLFLEHERPWDYQDPDFYIKRQQYEEKHLQFVKRNVESTKVVFLSATPFAYHKSIKYADGCLFDISEALIEKEQNFNSYNEASGFDKFLIEHFGYRMKYNKVTIPETGVDVNLLEREFFEKFKDAGVMSTRILELDYDYSRHFITIDSSIGEFINSGIEMFYDEAFCKKYKILSELFGKKYNYNYVNQLLECIKAKEIHERIKQHIYLNRKIVIFHSYNNSAIDHPFHFNPGKLLSADDAWKTPALTREIAMYEEEFPEYWNLDLSDLRNTRDAILEHFPFAKQFNGTISKKLRSKYLDDFNNDLSGENILIVQEKAGKEGLSAHDKTGIYQRVLINLGLPTAPTTAIQEEGRIYREGLRSNAIYEYATLQTNFERIAFGEKIAMRSRTAENLAMGHKARDLETAFKDGYLDSNYDLPSLEQGTGGKEKDKFSYILTIFEKSKSYYWKREKRNSRNKAKEGIDYFATPEPLGYKMVEWVKPIAEEKGLEPSAGHGAIARWFPEDTTNHYVEPSINLMGELAINAVGTVKSYPFEAHSIINKYNFIVMNPPFGIGGKVAMEHIQKACVKHSSFNFRLISIIPVGPSMDKRLDEFFQSDFGSNFFLEWSLRLPECTFERAGTKTMCKVIKIIHKTPYNQHIMPRFIDLSYIATINELFDAIEHLEI